MLEGFQVNFNKNIKFVCSYPRKDSLVRTYLDTIERINFKVIECEFHVMKTVVRIVVKVEDGCTLLLDGGGFAGRSQGGDDVHCV